MNQNKRLDPRELESGVLALMRRADTFRRLIEARDAASLTTDQAAVLELFDASVRANDAYEAAFSAFITTQFS